MLATMLLAERLLPARHQPRAWRRWPGNAGLLVIGTVLVRLLFPLVPVAFAAGITAAGIGILPALGIGGLTAVIVAVVVLDGAIYWQHRLLHWLPWLWPLHRVHHADTDFDATTALRFHPLEILLSMVFKFALIAALGAPPLAVLLFEILLNASALFNHANLKLPGWLDKALRVVIVTPDMHRVHHSSLHDETNSNFGFCLSLWDRCFGSYRASAREPQDTMTIGLDSFREPAEARLDALLSQPFRRTSKH